MTAFLIFVLFMVVIIGWLMLRDQIQRIESRFRLSAKEERSALEQEIAALAGRLRILEQQLERGPANPVQSVPQTEAEHVTAVPRAAAPVPETAQPALPTTPEAAPLSYEPIAVDSAGPDRSPAPPLPNWSDRLRGWLSNSEWEALVAGSLLN
jgi:hypothetical protein